MSPIQSLTKLPAQMTTFGEKLKYFREQKELTQEDFAAAINKKFSGAKITRDLVAGWENNRHYPQIHTAIIVCDYLKITLDELFRDTITIRMITRRQAVKTPK